ncbi:hypothetical protein LTS08_005006 [Lithohypha guttulata]|nr:hypothetical protein LTS08_005006 [Lithohypha guttulata]
MAGAVAAAVLPTLITQLPNLINTFKGLFGAAEEDAPLTSEQVEAAKRAQAALQKVGSSTGDYEGDQAAFLGSIFLPGITPILDLATGGASRNPLLGALFPLISQTQDFESSNEKVPSPDQAKGPVDTALAEAYRFIQTLT